MHPRKHLLTSAGGTIMVAWALLLCFSASAAGAPSSQAISMQIIGRVADVMDQLKDMTAKSQVSNPKTGQAYSMNLGQKVYDNLDTKSVVVIESPQTLKGMTFLFQSLQGEAPAQWIFIPKTLRVRQIAAFDEASFLGMEVQFEDFQFLQLAQLDDAVFRILKPQDVDGQRCAVIEKIYGDEARFKKKVLYISEKEIFPIKIESYDKKNKLQMTSTFKKITPVQNIPTPHIIELTDHEKDQTIIINISEIHYNNNISESFFRLDDLRTASTRLAKLWQKKK